MTGATDMMPNYLYILAESEKADVPITHTLTLEEKP